MERFRSWAREKRLGLLLKWLLLIVLSLFLLLVLTAIVGSPTWEILDLLIVPAVLAVGAWWLNKTEKENERELALDRQRQESLEQYLDRRSELLLIHSLTGYGQEYVPESPEVEFINRHVEKHVEEINAEGKEARMIARARTLTVLPTLDRNRKGTLIRFLYEAGLITRGKPVVNLAGADLGGANLTGAYLVSANLRKARLVGSNLEKADLCMADLKEANLFRVELREATYSIGFFATNWPEDFDPEARWAIPKEIGNPSEKE